MADSSWRIKSLEGTGGRQPKKFKRTGTLASGGANVISIGNHEGISVLGAALNITNWNSALAEDLTAAISGSTYTLTNANAGEQIDFDVTLDVA